MDGAPNILRRNLILLMVVALPLLSYPLIWFPRSWLQIRFGFVLPIGAIVLVAVLLLAAGAAVRGELRFGPPVLLWPLAILCVSWLMAIRVSLHPYFSLMALMAPVTGLTICFVASRFPANYLRRLCWFWLTAGVIVSLIGLMRLRSDPEFVSTIGNRNFLGAYLAATIIIGLALWDKRAALCVIPLMAAMFFCRSRGSWLALGVALVVWMVYRGSIAASWKRFLQFSLGVFALGIGTYFVFANIGKPVRTDVRYVIWRGTLAMINDRPIFGHGLGTFAVDYPRYRSPEYFKLPRAGNLTDHAHNELLEITAEQGVFGLVATLWLFAAALWQGSCACRNSSTDSLLRAGLLGATVVFLLHGLVDIDLRFPPNQPLFWLLLGLHFNGEGHQTPGIPLRQFAPRFLFGVVLVFGAGYVALNGIVQPMRADWLDRQSQLAKGQADEAAVRGDDQNMLCELQAAAGQARLALEIQPFRLTTRYFLAEVLAQIPTSEARLQAIEQCLFIEELAPDYADITFNLGQLYLSGREFNKALPYLERAVKINPYSADKRIQLAFAQVESGNHAAALRELKAVLRLDPANEWAKSILIDLQRSVVP